MEVTERERDISAAILLTVLSVSILYQFPGLIGASNSFIGSGAQESDVPRGELVFMQNTRPDQAEIGDLISFRYEINSEDSIVLVRTVIDERYEDDVRELNVRDPEGQGTIWISENSVLREERLRLPFLGNIILYLNSFVGILILIVAPLSVIVYYELEQIEDELDEDLFN